jgi:hypothetical protein
MTAPPQATLYHAAKAEAPADLLAEHVAGWAALWAGGGIRPPAVKPFMHRPVYYS